MQQVPAPPEMEMLKELDPDLADLVLRIRHKALYTDGALSSGLKLLMAATLDAAAGNISGCAILLRRAMSRGISPQQVAEAMATLYSVGGLRPLLEYLKAYRESLEASQ